MPFPELDSTQMLSVCIAMITVACDVCQTFRFRAKREKLQEFYVNAKARFLHVPYSLDSDGVEHCALLCGTAPKRVLLQAIDPARWAGPCLLHRAVERSRHADTQVMSTWNLSPNSPSRSGHRGWFPPRSCAVPSGGGCVVLLGTATERTWHI